MVICFHRVQPAAQLVPKQEQPVGMVIEQLAELYPIAAIDVQPRPL